MAARKLEPKVKRKPTAAKPRKPVSRAASKAAAQSRSGAGAQRAEGKEASRLIDARIRSLGDWRGEALAAMRRLILAADPEMVEEWKWMGTPVWSHAGNVCTGETYKQVVKLTFARGASLPDPLKLFNSSLDGNTRRAIDLREGETIDPKAFQALVQAAVAENLRARGAKAKPAAKPAALTEPKAAKKKTAVAGVLAGGNPRIAKADGDAPVQAYIAAMPGWKRDVGQRLDALIVRAVPKTRKAVKWNSPFYGVAGQGWFLSFHVFTRYVKVTFFRGTDLRPALPGGTERSKDARWIDIHEGDSLDEAQFSKWVKQAAALPGWST